MVNWGSRAGRVRTVRYAPTADARLTAATAPSAGGETLGSLAASVVSDGSRKRHDGGNQMNLANAAPNDMGVQ